MSARDLPASTAAEIAAGLLARGLRLYAVSIKFDGGIHNGQAWASSPDMAHGMVLVDALMAASTVRFCGKPLGWTAELEKLQV